MNASTQEFLRKLYSPRAIYLFLTWPCFIDKNQGENIFLLGSGRSGTTWCEEVLNHDLRLRIIFEPFHMTRGLVRSQPAPWEWVDPEAESPEVHKNLSHLLYGNFRNKWVDSWNLKRFRVYTGRCFKAIRAHTFVGYIARNFPDIKLIYIMRHPLGALASYLHRDWPSRTDEFLSQKSLTEGLLAPHLSFIKQLSTKAELTTLRWCLENYIALYQLGHTQAKAHVVFYEDMVIQPERELQRFADFLGPTFRLPNIAQTHKPSFHSKLTDKDYLDTKRIEKWKQLLSEADQQAAMRVVEQFRLDAIYDMGFRPRLDDPQQALQTYVKSSAESP